MVVAGLLPPREVTQLAVIVPDRLRGLNVSEGWARYLAR
jgi:hypothetical protein